jgi:hypothetical protein
VLSIGSAVVTSLLLDRARPAAEGDRDQHHPGAVDEPARRQAELEAAVAELRAALAPPAAQSAGRSRAPLIDEEALERAVDRALERRERRADADDAKDDAAAASRLLAELLALDLDGLVTAAGGPEAGCWGAKGAAAFERALELDETNWDARYTLAQHFYYADMRGDSIRQLERLIEQQQGRPAEGKHANAFVLLGNLHMDAGHADDALAAWRAGLQRFPGNAALLERLRAYE